MLQAIHQKIKISPNEKDRKKSLEVIHYNYCDGDLPKISHSIGYFIQAFELYIDKDKINDVFWHVRDSLNESALPNVRKAIVTCYLLGGFLLSIVFFENIYVVILLI